MAHPGPNVPHRTPRTRALEIGTTPGGFEGGVAYDPAAGAPAGTPGVGTAYVQQPPHVADVPAKFQNKPFKLGG